LEEILMLHQRKAFTLLELMVALIIMAIPSAIVVPSLLGVVANAKIAANSSTALDLADSVYDTNSSTNAMVQTTAAQYQAAVSAEGWPARTPRGLLIGPERRF
jgi:prepilin-type N-terminal cleavage/methylation domain-containing protein